MSHPSQYLCDCIKYKDPKLLDIVIVRKMHGSHKFDTYKLTECRVGSSTVSAFSTEFEVSQFTSELVSANNESTLFSRVSVYTSSTARLAGFGNICCQSNNSDDRCDKFHCYLSYDLKNLDFGIVRWGFGLKI